ncbi:hypothetical protein JOM56_013111 [Amanita muscaria]
MHGRRRRLLLCFIFVDTLGNTLNVDLERGPSRFKHSDGKWGSNRQCSGWGIAENDWESVEGKVGKKTKVAIQDLIAFALIAQQVRSRALGNAVAANTCGVAGLYLSPFTTALSLRTASIFQNHDKGYNRDRDASDADAIAVGEQMMVPQSPLELFYQKQLILADRGIVESNADELLKYADKEGIALLVSTLVLYVVHIASLATALSKLNVDLLKVIHDEDQARRVRPLLSSDLPAMLPPPPPDDALQVVHIASLAAAALSKLNVKIPIEDLEAKRVKLTAEAIQRRAFSNQQTIPKLFPKPTMPANVDPLAKEYCRRHSFVNGSTLTWLGLSQDVDVVGQHWNLVALWRSAIINCHKIINKASKHWKERVDKWQLLNNVENAPTLIEHGIAEMLWMVPPSVFNFCRDNWWMEGDATRS